METNQEYEVSLFKLKEKIDQDIKEKGFSIIDKLDIGWEQLVELSVDYVFKFPLDTDKYIEVRKC
jgi:hypothetical protein